VDVYLVALYAHILGAMLLFALLGIETMGLLHLRSAQSVEAARSSAGLMRVMPTGAPVALLLIVGAGLWMAWDRWSIPAWTMIALAAVVVMVVAGMVVTGGVMRRLGPRIGQAQGVWSPELAGAVRDPMLVRSLALRVGLAIAIVAVMVFKPDLVSSLVAVIAGGVIGLAASLAV
jgi:hypothetical protein